MDHVSLATTLAQDLAKSNSSIYYSWDIAEDRKALLNNRLEASVDLWIFDEILKRRAWRNWLKGIYDANHAAHKILVTGSARLDIFKRAGDSLQGRYFYHRLHPLTFSEYVGLNSPELKTSINSIVKLGKDFKSDWNQSAIEMLEMSGFPEPLLSGKVQFAKRWRALYADLMIRSDLRDLEHIIQTDKIEMFFDRLPETIGTPFSSTNMSADLEVTHVTILRWLKAFERLFACFVVMPYGAPRIRAIKEAKKVYLWDWARVPDPGARLENMLATHLLRLCDWSIDVLGEKLELRYFRTVNGHEVDFILLRNRLPWIAIEVRGSESPCPVLIARFMFFALQIYASRYRGSIDHSDFILTCYADI